MATVLPAGVTEEAVQAFVDALGADAVLTSDEDLLEWRDPYDFKGSDEYTGSAVVMPTHLSITGGSSALLSPR